MTNYLDAVDDDRAMSINSGRVSRVEAMTNAMLAQVGGVRNFAGLWHQLIELAIDQDKLHLAVKAMDSLTKLAAMSHEADAERIVPVGDMTDEQLEAESTETILRYVWQDPSIAVLVLETQGWGLSPPDSSFVQPSFADFVSGCRRV